MILKRPSIVVAAWSILVLGLCVWRGDLSLAAVEEREALGSFGGGVTVAHPPHSGTAFVRGVGSAAGAVLVFDLPEEDDDADVFVDGNYVGQVNEVHGAVRVAPGKHRVEVRKPGRFPIQETVEVDRSRREQTRQVRGELLSNPLES